MLKLSINHRLCPHLPNPFDDCHCLKMTSQDIEKTVNLCSYDYSTCDIYRNSDGNGHQAISSNHNNERVNNAVVA